MVDTAMFSIFHRAPPPPPPAPVEPAVATSSAPAEATLPELAAPPAPEPVEVAAEPAEPAPAEPQPAAAAPVPPPAEPELPSPHPVDAAEASQPEPPPVIPTPAEPTHASEEPASAPMEEAPAVELAAEGPALPPASVPDVVDLPEPQLVELPEEAWVAAAEPEPAFDRADESAVEPMEPTVWHGPAEIADVPLAGDQLGLANPVVITVLARLADYAETELDASRTGIYRPQGFRPAPWSGFAYDQVDDGRTGFAAGTRILTSRGEMEVERLLPGDTALTLRSPALLPITWIGRSSATAAPILIEAGALGPDLPRRPLCLAPDQAVYVEPIPVPAGRLVNGTTIRPLDHAAVDLFHVDVGRAEILFAEGLPLSSSDRNRVQAGA